MDWSLATPTTRTFWSGSTGLMLSSMATPTRSGVGRLSRDRPLRPHLEHRLHLAGTTPAFVGEGAAGGDHPLEDLQRVPPPLRASRQKLGDGVDRALFIEREQEELLPKDPFQLLHA